MKIKVYGETSRPKILGLHPMLSDGASMVYLAGKLRERYCIIAPELSGHGGDSEPFESAAREAETLYAYLQENRYMELALVYGASLGAAVGLELLAKPGLSVQAAVFDGCPLYRDAPLLRWMLTRVFLQKHKKAVRDPALSERKMTEQYGPDAGPKMGRAFVGMSDESIRAIVETCTKCAFPRYPKALERRLHFEYGSKDFDGREGKKNLAKYYPDASLTIRDGYGHCQYLSSLGERYGEVLEAYLQEESRAGISSQRRNEG